MKKLLVILTILVACMMLAACAPQKGAPTASPVPAEPATAPAAPAETPAAPEETPAEEPAAITEAPAEESEVEETESQVTQEDLDNLKAGIEKINTDDVGGISG